MTEVDYQLGVHSMILSKAGSERSECEDSIGIRCSVQRFCVADGATEAFDSRRWARLLTKHWVLSNRSLMTREQLGPWLGDLGERFRKRWEKRKLPWYAEEKARSGAFTTFLGLTLFQSKDDWTWQALAIGDSCLIHRSRERVQSFPISDPAQFGYHPFLFPSDASRLDAAIDHVVIRDGRARNGDVFLLLTDAIAAWYLNALNSSPELAAAFDSYLATDDNEELQALVSCCRRNGSLRNDDVAAIRVAVNRPSISPEDNRKLPRK